MQTVAGERVVRYPVSESVEDGKNMETLFGRTWYGSALVLPSQRPTCYNYRSASELCSRLH